MTSRPPAPWYREPTMLFVVAVLGFTLISGITMLAVSSTQHDRLIMSDEQYREWKDTMRATTPPRADD